MIRFLPIFLFSFANWLSTYSSSVNGFVFAGDPIKLNDIMIKWCCLSLSYSNWSNSSRFIDFLWIGNALETAESKCNPSPHFSSETCWELQFTSMILTIVGFVSPATWLVYIFTTRNWFLMILVKLKNDLVIHLLTARVLAGAGVTQLDNTFVTKIMGESCFYRLCCPVTSILPQG